MRSLAARWVSIGGHPFVMLVILAAVASLRRAQSSAELWRALGVIAAALLPMTVLIIRQVRRGRWLDVDASRPADRPLLFRVALLTIALVSGFLWFRDPGSYLLRGLGFSALLVASAALLSRWIKVSLHLALASFAAAALSFLGSKLGYVLFGFCPVLAWSRLALGRHRPSEVLVGFALGVTVGVWMVASV